MLGEGWKLRTGIGTHLYERDLRGRYPPATQVLDFCVDRDGLLDGVALAVKPEHGGHRAGHTAPGAHRLERVILYRELWTGEGEVSFSTGSCGQEKEMCHSLQGAVDRRRRCVILYRELWTGEGDVSFSTGSCGQEKEMCHSLQGAVDRRRRGVILYRELWTGEGEVSFSTGSCGQEKEMCHSLQGAVDRRRRGVIFYRELWTGEGDVSFSTLDNRGYNEE
ncbi:hypothetical protein EGW08_008207 [Elysia chlorotica]|uniref:Uncharacterized protein n=1 Tax=Elysia chlorotica TaxID=188477 RepID=A0A433TQZ4_ELYCH|nr:hypothetical protein EGW08_008207 [Elysia chlorotica]